MTTWPVMPDCGVYLVWPCDGLAWIHPDDVSLAEKWIPSSRVFRRHGFDGQYYRLQYGDDVIRVEPTLWRRVDDEGFSVGDRVEILSNFNENEPGLAVITEIRFDKSGNRIVYSLEAREMPLPRQFLAADFVPLTTRPKLNEPDSPSTVLEPRPATENDLPELNS